MWEQPDPPLCDATNSQGGLWGLFIFDPLLNSCEELAAPKIWKAELPLFAACDKELCRKTPKFLPAQAATGKFLHFEEFKCVLTVLPSIWRREKYNLFRIMEWFCWKRP